MRSTTLLLALTGPLPIHPRTGLRAVGIVAGRPVWPIRGGSSDHDDGDGDGDADDAGDDGAGDGDGQDDGDVDWKARAEAAEKDRDRWKNSSRKHETRVKEKNKELEQARSGKQQSDDEKAVDEARREERAKVRREYGGRLVEEKIRGRAAGRLSEEQVDTLLDGLNRERFLDDDGEVDADAVHDYVDRIAPPRNRDRDDDRDEDRRDRRGGARGGAGMGQGRNRSGGRAPGVEAGKALYEERRGKRST